MLLSTALHNKQGNIHPYLTVTSNFRGKISPYAVSLDLQAIVKPEILS